MLQSNNLAVKALLVIALAIAFSFNVFAGGSSADKVILDNETVRITAVKVSFKDVQNGIDGDYYELKFENKTDKSLYLTWDLELQYDNGCLNCSDEERLNEYIRNIQLSPKQVYESDCKKPEDSKYVIFSKYNNMQSEVLIDFFFRNLNVYVL